MERPLTNPNRSWEERWRQKIDADIGMRMEEAYMGKKIREYGPQDWDRARRWRYRYQTVAEQQQEDQQRRNLVDQTLDQLTRMRQRLLAAMKKEKRENGG